VFARLRACHCGGGGAFRCTRVILGTVHPVAPVAESAPIPVADLLIQPGQFPAGYRVVLLDATAVYRALQDAPDTQALDAVFTDAGLNVRPIRGP
jgi:hypothetical protein